MTQEMALHSATTRVDLIKTTLHFAKGVFEIDYQK